MKREGTHSQEHVDIVLEDGGRTTRYKKRLPAKIPKDTGTTWYYLGFVGDIGFTIAIPIALGAIIGNVLDARWGTYPRLTLGLLFFGIAISVVGFIKKIQELIRSA